MHWILFSYRSCLSQIDCSQITQKNAWSLLQFWKNCWSPSRYIPGTNSEQSYWIKLGLQNNPFSNSRFISSSSNPHLPFRFRHPNRNVVKRRQRRCQIDNLKILSWRTCWRCPIRIHPIIWGIPNGWRISKWKRIKEKET